MRVIELEAFPLEAVKELVVPSIRIEDGPVKLMINSVLENPPAVLLAPLDEDKKRLITFEKPTTDIQLPFGESQVSDSIGEHGYSLWQPTMFHARSFILEHPDLEEGITDEYGNHFSTFSVKGNNFSEPGVIETATAHNGYIAYGLQEGVVIERVLKASEMLRSIGVDTEFTIGICEPKEMPLRNTETMTDEVQMLGRNAYKDRIATDHWSQLSSEEGTFEKLAEIEKAIGGTAYYVFVRATDSPYRLAESLVLDDVFKKVATELGREDLSRDEYLREIILPRVANNLATMHSAGLAHRFPVSGNISALGSIVDLDSVHGEPLGFDDDPINENDIALDLIHFLGTVNHLTDINDILMLYREDCMSMSELFLREYVKALKSKNGIEYSIENIMNYFSYLAKEYPSAAVLRVGGVGTYAAQKIQLENLDATNIDQESLGQEIEKSTEQILEIAIELYREDAFYLFDCLALDFINHCDELLEDKDFEAAIDRLHKDYSSVGDAIGEYVARAIAIFIDRQDESHPYKPGDDIDPLMYAETTDLVLQYFQRQKSNIETEFMKSYWVEIRAELLELVTTAHVEKELLIGDVYIAWLSEKGNFIYEGSFDEYIELREFILKNRAVLNVLPADSLSLENGDRMYISGNDKKVLQHVSFSPEEACVSSYSYNHVKGQDEFGLSLSPTGVALFVVQSKDGSIEYDLVVEKEDMVDEQALSSKQAFLEAINYRLPPQMSLFDIDLVERRNPALLFRDKIKL